MARGFRTAKNLRFRIAADGVLRASVSKSAGEYNLGLEIVKLLELVDQGVSEKELASKLKKALGRLVEEAPKADEVEALLADLHDAGVLVREGSTGGGAEDGFGDPWIQWAMIADDARTLAYLEALKRVVTRDSVVLDVGAGTGVFSAYALALGAKQVVAIEETASAKAIPGILAELGIAAKGRFSVVASNSADARIPQGVNVVVSELFGNDPFSEGMLATLDDLFRKLPKGAVALPRSVEVCAEVVDLVAGPLLHRVRAFSNPTSAGKSEPTEFLRRFQAAAKKTLDFSEISFDAALAKGDAVRASAPVTLKKFALNPPRESEFQSCPAREIVLERQAAVPVLLVWYRAELVEGVTLSSRVGEDDGCEHWSPVLVPLRRPLKVGEKLRLEWGMDDEHVRVVVRVSCENEVLGERR